MARLQFEPVVQLGRCWPRRGGDEGLRWVTRSLFKILACYFTDIFSIVWALGKLGFVWQFITLGGLHSNAYISDLFAAAFAKEGMKA